MVEKKSKERRLPSASNGDIANTYNRRFHSSGSCLGSKYSPPQNNGSQKHPTQQHKGQQAQRNTPRFLCLPHKKTAQDTVPIPFSHFARTFFLDDRSNKVSILKQKANPKFLQREDLSGQTIVLTILFVFVI
jgi:hypothetical protein